MGCGASNRNTTGAPQATNSNGQSSPNASSKPEQDGAVKKKTLAMFQTTNVAQGDEFMAVVPCKEALIEPDKHPPHNPLEPVEEYKLEYVYGYRTEDCFMNSLYSASNKVVFYTGAVGAVLDPVSNTQKFFGGIGISSKSGGIINQHNDTITCMAMSKDRKYVATAQLGRYPVVYIWNTETCTLKTGGSKIRLGEQKYMPKGVSAMAFSETGEYIALADLNDEHRVYVYTVDGHEQKFMAPSMMVGTVVKAIAWTRKSVTMDQEVFCTAGKKSLKFWYPFAKDKPPFLAKFPNAGMITDFFSAVYDDQGRCYTGGANGYIYVWEPDGTSSIQVMAHQGVVYAINITSNGKLISGGADCKIAIHSLPEGTGGLKKETEHKFRAAVVSVDSTATRVLAGLLDASIVEVQVDQDNYFQVLMQGHSDGYLTALDVIEDNIITAGEDNKIVVWNYTDRSAFITSLINKTAEKGRNSGSQSKFPDNQRCRVLTVSKMTGHIALGVNNGKLQIREGCYMLDHVVYNDVVVPGGKMISTLKYSADGKKLAVAAQDMNVYMYGASAGHNYEKLAVISGKDGYITDMDWSTNGVCIRGLCNTFSVHFFDSVKMKINESGAEESKKLEWCTGNMKLTWGTEGVYPKGCDGEHVKSVAISYKKTMVATGDAWNMINIYRNPCRRDSKCKSLRGHSSTVYAVAFSPDDGRIFSVAGPDRSLMQWKLDSN